MIRFRYDPREYDFKGLIEELLGAGDLSRLHEAPLPRPDITRAIARGLLVKKLYDNRDRGLDALIRRFIEGPVTEAFGPIVSCQERACLRVHMHGQESITAFHQDRDWGQADVVENVWVPFTPVWGNNSMWVESEPLLGDYRPLELEYGEAVIFRGAVLRHGSLPNDSGSTRVSADIRIWPGRR